MTGEVTRAAAGMTNASATIKRLNEVITSVAPILKGADGLAVGARFYTPFDWDYFVSA